jgi:hypothetical protein
MSIVSGYDDKFAIKVCFFNKINQLLDNGLSVRATLALDNFPRKRTQSEIKGLELQI